jgi:hypothetical protein
VKKIILILFFWGTAFCLYAQDSGEAEGKERGGFTSGILGYLDNPDVQTRHLDRKRVFDLRLAHIDSSMGNNLISLKDFFTKQIVIDMSKLNRRTGGKGALINADFGFLPIQININPTQRWGGGFGANVLGRFDLSIPAEFLDLIAEGNEGRLRSSGEFTVSGSIFYEIALNVHGTLPFFNGKLSFGVDPAFYSPLFYIPRSGIGYTMDTDNRILVSAGGSFRAYTPINFNAISISDMFSIGGVDLSLSAEYALFSRLDLGLSISHIPIFPARMYSGYEISLPETKIIDVADLTKDLDLDDLINTDFEFTGDDNFTSLPALTVFRPMRFDFYNIFRPFAGDFFSIRPNIGFTILTASKETYFNMGIRLTMDVKRIFVLYFDSGLGEGLWRNKLGFEVNLRAFELGLEAGMCSQNYLPSWTAFGLSLKLGIAFGF